MSGELRLSRLRQCLRDGIASGADVDVRSELGLGNESPDRDVARSLVQILSAVETAAIDLSAERRHDERPGGETVPAAGPETSFLGRLAGAQAPGVDELEDPRTLLAVLKSGSLRHRRAAIHRLHERLKEGQKLPGDQLKLVQEALTHLRDVELAFERSLLLEELAGAPGRSARAEREQWEKLVSEVESAVLAFWDGELREEPLRALPGDQRALLMLRARALPDTVLGHISAILEGADGLSSWDDRLALLSSLRYAGDPRLAPTLRGVLDGRSGDLVTEAARALGRIDDPRVHGALVAAYDRSVVDTQRAVLAGALAALGDLRGLLYVRGLLESDDDAARLAAMEALEAAGGTEDSERVTRLLETDDPVVVAQAVRTLARVGDSRALRKLGELRNGTRVPALWAQIEDAEESILARMELRGEERQDEHTQRLSRVEEDALARDEQSLGVRLRAWKDYLIGHVWLAFGALSRAVGRFETAATRRAGWAPPLVAIAMAHMRRTEFAKALAAFRRALDADRWQVERNPLVMRALTHAFLRRAEQMERDGRTDIAQGLVGEVLTLDLRRAPGAVRFELERKRSALQRTEAA